MIFKVYFEKTNKHISFNNQHQMNGFIFKMLGDKAKKYHESFSNYSISSIQGGKGTKEGIIFESEPYIQIATNNNEICVDFINAILETIDTKRANFFGLFPTRFETFDFPCGNNFDVVKTISPILLKKDGKKLNIKNENWLEALNENCKKKLQHEGIEDPTFKIVIGNKESVRTKMIWVDDVFNPCTEGFFTVYGKKESRKTLYSLGIGNSTGTGFGAIKILVKNNER